MKIKSIVVTLFDVWFFKSLHPLDLLHSKKNLTQILKFSCEVFLRWPLFNENGQDFLLSINFNNNVQLLVDLGFYMVENIFVPHFRSFFYPLKHKTGLSIFHNILLPIPEKQEG